MSRDLATSTRDGDAESCDATSTEREVIVGTGGFFMKRRALNSSFEHAVKSPPLEHAVWPRRQSPLLEHAPRARRWSTLLELRALTAGFNGAGEKRALTTWVSTP